MAVIMAVIALFREDKFAENVRAIFHKPHHPDDLKQIEKLTEINKNLQRDQDVTKAFMEMLEDNELVMKYNTLKRVMRTHKKFED